MQSSAEISRSRDHAWDAIKTRHHEVIKVYLCGPDSDDLLLIGKVTMGFRNGKAITEEFAANFVVSGADTQKPRVKLYQVWAVRAEDFLLSSGYAPPSLLG